MLYSYIYTIDNEIFSISSSVIRIPCMYNNVKMELLSVCCWNTSLILNYLITYVALLPKCMYRSTDRGNGLKQLL